MNNFVIAKGNVGSDPKVYDLKDGRKKLVIAIAVNKRYRDKDGNTKEIPNWIDVAKYGKGESIDRLISKISKGDYIEVVGELASYVYEKDGIKRKFTYINARSIVPIYVRNKEKPKDVQATAEPEVPDVPLDDFPEDLPIDDIVEELHEDDIPL